MDLNGWQAELTRFDRVRAHTAADVIERLDDRLRRRIDECRAAGPAAIARRLEELDREWDIERLLEANAASLATLGAVAGLVWRRSALLVPVVVGGFLLQHAIQGWCPPLAVFRRLGVRTRREIDLERFALKVARGDFSALSDDTRPERLLAAAVSR
jgi:hypothetical protein